MKGRGYKLVVMDVDGTLTDGNIYISSDGEQFKAFNIKDGYGVKHILKKYGIQTAIITGRQSKIVEKRAEEIDIDYLYQGVENKLTCLEQIIEKLECTFEEVVYIGDDVNDLPCMEKVGMSCCPADAHERVKRAVGYIAEKKAGQGAVRECIDYLISLL